MLEYDGPLVRKNRELSEFTHTILGLCVRNPAVLIDTGSKGEWVSIKDILKKALLAREVPYSHPIYGALEPKGGRE